MFGIVSIWGLKSQTYLRIHLADNIEKFSYEKVTEVVFYTDGLSVIAEGETFPFLYSDISKIDFEEAGSSGVIPVGETSPCDLRLEGDIITNSDGAKILIYSTLGLKMAQYEGSGNISTLPAGIYLAISNGKKLKFVKR